MLLLCSMFKNIAKKKIAERKILNYNTISARINVIAKQTKKKPNSIECVRGKKLSQEFDDSIFFSIHACKNVWGINFVWVCIFWEGTLFYFRIIEIGFCILQTWIWKFQFCQSWNWVNAFNTGPSTIMNFW